MRIYTSDRRDWLLFTAMLIIGIFLLQFSVNIASSVPGSWEVESNLESNLDPDGKIGIKLKAEIHPVLPEIMTPPAWDTDQLLTPITQEDAPSTVVPLAYFNPTNTPVVNAQGEILGQGSNPVDSPGLHASETAMVTQAASPTSKPSSTPTATLAKGSATPTQTQTPTLTTTSTATKTPFPTYTPTATSTVVKASPTATPRPTRTPKNSANSGKGGGKKGP